MPISLEKVEVRRLPFTREVLCSHPGYPSLLYPPSVDLRTIKERYVYDLLTLRREITLRRKV